MSDIDFLRESKKSAMHNKQIDPLVQGLLEAGYLVGRIEGISYFWSHKLANRDDYEDEDALYLAGEINELMQFPLKASRGHRPHPEIESMIESHHQGSDIGQE